MLNLLAMGLFLGLTAEQTLALTPRHLDAVWQLYLDSEERQTERIAFGLTEYYNMNKSKDAPRQTIQTMYPGIRRKSNTVRPGVGKVVSAPLVPADLQVEWARQFTKASRGRH